MADGNILLSVAKIVCLDSERRYVVVSAPGKRFSGDTKVTDLLFECFDAYKSGDMSAFNAVFGKICARFESISNELGGIVSFQEDLQKIKAELFDGAGQDYCVSRGEYLSAKALAAVLNAPFVDATEFVRFDEKGDLSDETYELAKKVLLKQYF